MRLAGLCFSEVAPKVIWVGHPCPKKHSGENPEATTNGTCRPTPVSEEKQITCLETLWRVLFEFASGSVTWEADPNPPGQPHATDHWFLDPRDLGRRLAVGVADPFRFEQPMRVIFFTRQDPIRERPFSSPPCNRKLQELGTFPNDCLDQSEAFVSKYEIFTIAPHLRIRYGREARFVSHMPSNSTIVKRRQSVEPVCAIILIRREQQSSGRFIQEVQRLTPIDQFTRNICDILFHPQWSCPVSPCSNYKIIYV
ncbi:hypothetical protein TNCV_1149151 [Trichonephila clavipes]|nr:hypothetical protein TNCV_1149151 [Trichonephila clavipes]